MQHKFLFRGKRLDNGKWVYGYFVESEHDLYNAYIITSAFWETDVDGDTDMISTELYTVDPNTVGRYIGLTDKNGVKIFEGDIVRLVYDGIENIFVVIWDSDELGFKATSGKENYGLGGFQYLPCCEEVEVIGNRFDTPELLGGNDGTIDT